MIKQQVLGIITLVSVVLMPLEKKAEKFLSPQPVVQETVLAKHCLDLNTRARNKYVNEVFKYNILLAVEKFGDGFVLQPGEVFAFHDNVLSKFKTDNLKTGWTRYEKKEGYKTVLGLPGNGVCHLATLMNWTASDAGLAVVAPINHNFAPVPGVPKKYGTSIRYCPSGCNSQNQNLYIKNTFDFPVKFVFEVTGDILSLKILQ